MSALLQITALPGETRAFLWQDERLAGLLVERAATGLRAGDRAVGRVRALDRRLQGAFVALPEGPDGLLPLNALPGLSEGQALAVRVVRAANEDKGPLLAPDGRPGEAPEAGPVPRLLARGTAAMDELLRAATAIETDDAALAVRLKARGLAARHLPQGFPADAAERQDAAVDSLLRPAVRLPGGGSLLLEAGRTLNAIDVNRGQATGRDLEVNLEAAAEIPRQLRLRRLGGRFVVDFLERGTDGEAIEARLRQGFAGDPARLKPVGWSRGGLYEFTRKRLEPSLQETLLEPAPFGGWRKQPLTLAFEALRALERAQRTAPGQPRRLVVEATLLPLLQGLPALAWLEQRLGRAPALLAGGPGPYRVEPEERP